MAGVYDAAVSEQMSQIGKEKKRRPGGLLDSELSSYLSKSAKHLCAALGGGGGSCQSLEGLFSRAPSFAACGARRPSGTRWENKKDRQKNFPRAAVSNWLAIIGVKALALTAE